MDVSSQKFSGFQWSKVIPDLLTVMLYLFLFDRLLIWQQQHLVLSCSLVMILNILATGLVTWHFFSAYQDENRLRQMLNSMSPLEAKLVGLAAFISSFAFTWWLVPFAAVKTMGVKETGFILGAGAYFIVYIAIVANAVAPAKKNSGINPNQFSLLSSLCSTFFFFFSYVFLVMALQHWHPSFAGSKWIGALCLIIFYLPLRFFILLRPPTARLEYIIFLLSFGFMLYELLLKV